MLAKPAPPYQAPYPPTLSVAVATAATAAATVAITTTTAATTDTSFTPALLLTHQLMCVACAAELLPQDKPSAWVRYRLKQTKGLIWMLLFRTALSKSPASI